MEKSLIAIVGSTGVGKSALALNLAECFDGEIVSADSRQVYRGMDIGTAKPVLEDRSRVPHHLLDICNPDETFNLACYLEQSNEAITDIQGRGKLPFLVGGTGLYVWGVMEGLRVPRVPPDEALRQKLQLRADTEGAVRLHEELRQVDAHSADHIDPRNIRRTIRALEVYISTGIPFSAGQFRKPPEFPVFILGLTMKRWNLNLRLDNRVETMLEKGWLDEVKLLLELGYSSGLPSFSSLGYRELADQLSGSLSEEDAVLRIKMGHRRFSRRQHAWFRQKDERIHWLDADSSISKKATFMVGSFLGDIHRL